MIESKFSIFITKREERFVLQIFPLNFGRNYQSGFMPSARKMRIKGMIFPSLVPIFTPKDRSLQRSTKLQREGDMFSQSIADALVTENNLIETFPTGESSPKGEVDPENCFMVRIWLWDERSQDFSIEKMEKPGHQMFEDYLAAYDLFDKMRQKDLPGLLGKEVKLDLVHYKFGDGRTIYSNILFPGKQH